MSAIPNQFILRAALPVPAQTEPAAAPARPGENAPASPLKTYPFEGAGQKLSAEQLVRSQRIIDSAKIFVLTPKLAGNKAAFPEIKFTPGQLLPFLTKNLFGKIRGTPYLTGGAASHILTGIEYADVDFSYYMNAEKDLHIPLALIQKFIAWKLGKIPKANGNEEMPPDNLHEYTLSSEDISHINYYYLQKKVRVPKKFSYIGLGEFELKFILIGNNPRCHVSTSDGFHIPIPLEYPKCKPEHATSSEPNFAGALDALKSRRMIVEKPGEVDDLLMRLVHKRTQGFEIDSETEVVKAALATLIKDYNHADTEKLKDFKTAVEKHQDNHYRKANVKGQMVDLLNFCTLIVQIENKEARHAYLKCLINIWKAKQSPLLNQFIIFAEKDLDNVNDLLAFMRGVFLLEWTNQNPCVNAYAFEFATQGRAASARLHFSLKHGHETQYLAISGHPGRIAEEFFVSWRNLEKRHAGVPEAAFTELAQGLGLSTIALTPSHRPVVVKTLLDRYGRPPISTVLDVNYKSAIPPQAFCTAIENQVKAIKADGCDVIAPEYIFKKTMQYRLEFYRSSTLKSGRRNVLEAVESVLQCLKSPQGKPSGNYFADKANAFAIQDLYFLTEPEKCMVASLLMQGWTAGLAAEQPAELLAIFNIACKIKMWPVKTGELDKHLAELLQALAPLLLSGIWHSMADVLASNRSPHEIQNRLHHFCKILAVFRGRTAAHKKLVSLADNVVTQYRKPLKDFIAIVSSFDLTEATSVMLNKPNFAALFSEQEKQKTLWALFQLHNKAGKASDMDSAFDLWKAGVKSNREVDPADKAILELTLANALLTRKAAQSDQMAAQIVIELAPVLNEMSDSPAAQRLKEGLLKLIDQLAKNGHSERLQLLQLIFKHLEEGPLLPAGHKIAVFQSFIDSTAVPDSGMMNSYLDYSFASNRPDDISKALEIVRIVIKRCLKEPQNDTFGLVWELFANVVKREKWNETFDKLLTNFIEAVPFDAAPRSEYERQMKNHILICQKALMKQASQASREALLKLPIILGNAVLFQELWGTIKSLYLPKKEILSYCSSFIARCAMNNDVQWLPVLRNIILFPNVLSDTAFSQADRAVAYHHVFLYAANLFHSAADKKKQAEYMQVLEGLWNQVSSILKDDSQKAKKRLIKDLVFKVYIKAATSDSLIKACGLVTIDVVHNGNYLAQFLLILSQFEALPPDKITQPLIRELGKQLAQSPTYIEIENGGMITRKQPLGELWGTMQRLAAKDESIYTDILQEALINLAEVKDTTKFVGAILRFNISQNYKCAKNPKALVNFLKLMASSKIATKEEQYCFRNHALSIFAQLPEQYAVEAEQSVYSMRQVLVRQKHPMSSFKEWITVYELMKSKNNTIYDRVIKTTLSDVVINLAVSPLEPEERKEVVRVLFDMVEFVLNKWLTLWKRVKGKNEEVDWVYETYLKEVLTPTEWEQYGGRMRNFALQPFVSSLSTLAANISLLDEMSRQAFVLMPIFQHHDIELGRKVVSQILAAAALPTAAFSQYAVELLHQAENCNLYPEVQNDQPELQGLRRVRFQDSYNLVIAVSHSGADSDFHLLPGVFLMFETVAKNNVDQIRRLMDASILALDYTIAKCLWEGVERNFQSRLRSIIDKLTTLDLSKCSLEVKQEYRNLLAKFFRNMFTRIFFCQTVMYYTYHEQNTGPKLKQMEVAKKSCMYHYGITNWGPHEKYLFDEVWKLTTSFCKLPRHHPSSAIMHNAILESIKTAIDKDLSSPEQAVARGSTALEIMREANQDNHIHQPALEAEIAKINQKYIKELNELLQFSSPPVKSNDSPASPKVNAKSS